MLIVIFRHGHKEFSADFDPNLSPKGFDQSTALLNAVQADKIPQPTHCWFSPRKRTRQTLEKAIDFFKPVTALKNELDVRASEETLADFRKRITACLNELEQKSSHKDCYYLCTHYDWLEEFLTTVNSNKDFNQPQFWTWAPADYMIFDVQDGSWNFQTKGSL